MLITEIQISVVMVSVALVSIVSAAVSVTAMFVSLRSRVADHEQRLRYHADEIVEIRREQSQTATQFAVIAEQLKHIREIVDKLGSGCS
ncbi:hypothetical protein [Spirochaeta africana]|uniref:Uncharacterized protein n=1 Tax=Spirochaeta africana (strain ATCC 700263 / DSM 8902 / Z-7692) TaxID=889378 RepID=H9UJD0_SPIAZ|nr:hypothetical protein [Spirochaeta africana]AFG37623.1 hypothetical protein Spiaf_1564 [Spirochaeta africana DSM 8902]